MNLNYESDDASEAADWAMRLLAARLASDSDTSFSVISEAVTWALNGDSPSRTAMLLQALTVYGFAATILIAEEEPDLDQMRGLSRIEVLNVLEDAVRLELRQENPES